MITQHTVIRLMSVVMFDNNSGKYYKCWFLTCNTFLCAQIERTHRMIISVAKAVQMMVLNRISWSSQAEFPGGSYSASRFMGISVTWTSCLKISTLYFDDQQPDQNKAAPAKLLPNPQLCASLVFFVCAYLKVMIKDYNLMFFSFLLDHRDIYCSEVFTTVTIIDP